jgi:hypothetical protein
MEKTSRQPKPTIGTIDDTPLNIDWSKPAEERLADMSRQIFGPFERAQEEYERKQKNKGKE